MRAKKANPAILDNPDIERLSSAIDRITLGAGALEPAAAQAPIRSIVYDRIVACADGGPSTADVVTWTRAIATTFHAQVWAVHVVEPAVLATGYAPYTGGEDTLEAFGRKALQWVKDELVRDRIPTTAWLRRGFVTSQALGAASESGAGLIVTGSHGASRWQHALLGSSSDGIKNNSGASVLIAKDRAPPGSILLPTDGSTPSRQAALVALGLAKAWKVPLLILHVVKSIAQDPAADEATFRETFGNLDVPPWKDRRVTFEARVGRPVDVILETAGGMDRPLIVMGSRGLSGLRTLVPGSVTNAVAHRSSQSVLIVK